MRKRVTIILLSMILISAAAICTSIQWQSAKPPSMYVRGPTYSPPGGRPLLKSGKPYIYQAPPVRQAQMEAGVKKLKLGMRHEDVRKMMGDLDIDMPDYKTMALTFRIHYIGNTWRYIFRSREPVGTNTNDMIISLSFSPNDRLESIMDARSGGH